VIQRHRLPVWRRYAGRTGKSECRKMDLLSLLSKRDSFFRIRRSMMKKKFSVLLEKDEDGYYVATVPVLPGCHTQAKSLDDLQERTKEAIEAYLEAEKVQIS
jgi:predicted RNase H-like HicB family nuclease